MNSKRKKGNPLVQVILWPFKSYLRILIFVIGFGLYLYQTFQVVLLTGEIRMLELERSRLLNETANLNVQIDQLTNINRIEKIAQEKFGLIPAGNQIKHLVIAAYETEEERTEEELNKKINLAGVQ